MFAKRNKGDHIISALDDILGDFSLYLRVEKRVTEGVARKYCYSVGKFLKWADTLDPERKHAVKYYDRMLKEKKKASTIANTLFALKQYYNFIDKDLDLKPPKRTVRQIDFLTVPKSSLGLH